MRYLYGLFFNYICGPRLDMLSLQRWYNNMAFSPLPIVVRILKCWQISAQGSHVVQVAHPRVDTY